MSDADIVSDILQRVVAVVPARLAQQLGLQITEIEMQVRRDWGGERHYIARRKDDPAAQQYIAQRNEQIWREYQRGERIPLLRRRHGISDRRLREIINAFESRDAIRKVRCQKCRNVHNRESRVVKDGESSCPRCGGKAFVEIEK